MTLNPKIALRLQFLARVVRRECQHLLSTDQRLFDHPFTVERARQLEIDPDLSERVEAFVGRFGRLQNTVGDKLLPMLLVALGETPAAAIDNLDRAERLDLLDSSDEWITMHQLIDSARWSLKLSSYRACPGIQLNEPRIARRACFAAGAALDSGSSPE